MRKKLKTEAQLSNKSERQLSVNPSHSQVAKDDRSRPYVSQTYMLVILFFHQKQLQGKICEAEFNQNSNICVHS